MTDEKIITELESKVKRIGTVRLQYYEDERVFLVVEWPSCMVRATGDTLLAALTDYTRPPKRRRKSAATPKEKQ